MKIDLTAIPTYVLTTGSPTRRAFVTDQLQRVGLQPQFIQGIHCEPGIIGCGLSHLKMMTLLGWADLPALILEDDVAVAEGFRRVLNVPDEADAAYLGVSTWGMFPDIHPAAINYATVATRFSIGWLRIHNMCSTHAILYLNHRYVEQSRAAIERALTILNRPFDISLALLQTRWTILTPTTLMFYQAAEVGGAYEATCRALLPVDDPSQVRIHPVTRTIERPALTHEFVPQL